MFQHGGYTSCHLWSFLAGLPGLLTGVGCGEGAPGIEVPNPLLHLGDDLVVVQPQSSGGREIASTGVPTVLFLNFGGETITKGTSEDASGNTSPSFSGTIPPCAERAELRDKITSRVKELYAAYNIQIVTTRPTSGVYDMVMIGGTGSSIQPPHTGGGVALLDCGNIQQGAIVFVFSDSARAVYAHSQLSADEVDFRIWTYLASAVAHESAHAYGLPHSDDKCDVMSYAIGCPGGDYIGKTFLDKTMGMQDSVGAGTCNLTSMNSHQMLLAALGSMPVVDTTPPAVRILYPTSGSSVDSVIKVQTELTDDRSVAKAEIRVDGILINVKTAKPFDFEVTMTAGDHTIEVTGYDASGNKATASVQVTVAGESGESGESTSDIALTGGCSVTGGVAGNLTLLPVLLVLSLAALVMARRRRRRRR